MADDSVRKSSYLKTDTKEEYNNDSIDNNNNSRDSKRRRSRSPSHDKKPRRSHPQTSSNSGGFRWKDTKRQNERLDATDRGDNHSGRKRLLERGYRDRSPLRRSRSDQTSKESTTTTGEVRDKYNIADKFGSSGSTFKDSRRKEFSTSKKEELPATRPSNLVSKSTTTASVNDGEPMIVVYVNDRLGTRAAIPCLASDSIHLFKAQVAARIGRQPHEIMLKRQGERPFKNQLTLEDYGVSNGVQLDLEIDTGD